MTVSAEPAPRRCHAWLIWHLVVLARMSPGPGFAGLVRWLRLDRLDPAIHLRNICSRALQGRGDENPALPRSPSESAGLAAKTTLRPQIRRHLISRQPPRVSAVPFTGEFKQASSTPFSVSFMPIHALLFPGFLCRKTVGHGKTARKPPTGFLPARPEPPRPTRRVVLAFGNLDANGCQQTPMDCRIGSSKGGAVDKEWAPNKSLLAFFCIDRFFFQLQSQLIALPKSGHNDANRNSLLIARVCFPQNYEYRRGSPIAQ